MSTLPAFSRAAARCPLAQLLARFIVSQVLFLPAEVPAGFILIIVIKAELLLVRGSVRVVVLPLLALLPPCRLVPSRTAVNCKYYYYYCVCICNN